jgi:hypothetical protein
MPRVEFERAPSRQVLARAALALEHSHIAATRRATLTTGSHTAHS